MSYIELFIIAVGLSMDAFAVSICKGLAAREKNWKNNLKAGLYFGGFQGLMPVLGYLLGVNFSAAISSVDHWVAFFLLLFIGGNMCKEALSGEEEQVDGSFSAREMLTLAVATSIDALAVGVSFAFLQVNIVAAAGFIAGVTFLFSAVGIGVGVLFGCRFKSRAELAGGVILILMGSKILLEHLGFLG